jgi:hypothetical protein
MVSIFNQRDKAWGNDLIGKSGLKLKDYGCLCTSISMLDGKSPKEVNDIFSKAGAYNSNGILNHEIASKTLGLEYTGFSNTPDYFPIIAEVDMSPSPGKQQHFVVQINNKEIVDPWTGTVRPIKTYPIISYRKYKNLKDYQAKNEDMKIPSKLKDEIQKYQDITDSKYKFGDNFESEDFEELKNIMSDVRNKYNFRLSGFKECYDNQTALMKAKDKAEAQVAGLNTQIEGLKTDIAILEEEVAIKEDSLAVMEKVANTNSEMAIQLKKCQEDNQVLSIKAPTVGGAIQILVQAIKQVWK